MSIERHAVQRIRAYVEPNNAFAVDHTGTLGDFTDLPIVEGSANITLTQTMLNPQTIQQHLDGYPTQVLGTKGCSIAFSMVLAPTGTAAADNTAQVQGPLGMILGAVMGGENLSKGDVVAASPAGTTSTFTVAAAATRNIKAGAAIGLLKGTGGTLEAREIEQVSTNAVTLKLAMSAAAATGNVAYGAATYYLKQDPDTSLQFIVEGYEQDDRWLLQGCQLESMTIDLPIGELPKITFNLKGVNWTYGASTSTPITGSALGTATYSSTSFVKNTGELMVATVGAVTKPAAIEAQSITFAPGFKFSQVKSPSGTQGVYRWRRDRVAPAVTGSFSTFYQDTTWFSVRDNKTTKAVWYQIGNTAGGTILISVPTAQVTDVQRADQEGLAGQVVSFAAKLDADTTEGTASDLGKSPFRIALL